MTRRQLYTPSAALAVAAVAGFGWLGFADRQPAAEPVRPESDLPHVWQWKVHHVPAPAVPTELQLVLRSREEPLAPNQPSSTADRALRPGEGTDRVLGGEYLARSAGGPRVTLQFLDLRKFGVGPEETADPLRAATVVKSGDAGWQATTRLGGHSLRGRPVVHADTWDDGELALLTLSTIATDAQYVYTFLLTVRPDYR